MKKSTTIILAATCLAAPAAALAFQEKGNQAEAQDGKNTTNRQVEAPELLGELSGLWEFTVEVNPNAWSKRMGADARQQGSSDARRSSDGESRDDADAEKDASGSEQARGHEGRSHNMRGITESQVIFGGNVLAMASVMAPDGGSSEKQWQLPENPERIMRSLSYFSFDPGAGTFDAVFMSDMDGSMHHAAGAYDAESRRIVFEASDEESGDEAKPMEASASSSKTSGKRKETAVLELIDDNTFAVTMYLGEAARRAEDGRFPGRPTTPPSGEEAKEMAKDAPDTGGLGPNVLYRATYCRATAEREKACRDAMKEDRRRQEEARGE